MHRCANCSFESETAFHFCPTCGIQRVGEADTAGLIGRTIKGKYRVLEELGSGSMGTVYLAEHVSLKKRVALKVLHKDLNVSEETLQRFQREGIAAGQVSHPNAIQIFDFDRDAEGHFFLAMEYVEGKSLKEVLAERGALSSADSLLLARQLLSTLVEAHRHGIVHRDLKPENLMVVRNSAGELSLKVLDFGLSKLIDRPSEASLQTRTGRVMGTPMYMAPEQWNGEEADQRTDLYATALILYEMLVGKQPFRGSNLTETFVKTTTEPPPSLSESQPNGAFPEHLDEVLQRGLAKSRDERFQSAAEMLQMLDGVNVVRAATVRRKSPAPRRSASRQAAGGGQDRRSLALWVGSGAVVVIASVGMIVFGGGTADGNGSPDDPPTNRAASGNPAPAPLPSGSYPLVSMMPPAGRSDLQNTYVSRLQSARADLRAGNDATARVTLDQAVNMPCVDAEAFVVRAAYYRRQGDADTAIADLRDALRRYPRYAQAITELGWIHLERGELDEAEKRFRAAAEMDGDLSGAQAGIGAVLVAQDQHAEALKLLDAAAETYPNSALVHAYRGRTQLALDMPEEALESLVDAKRLDPSLGPVYEDLAEVYLLKGDERAAEQNLRVAFASPNASDTVRSRMADLLLGQEKFAEAAGVLEPLVSDDAPADVHVMWGVVQLAQGEREAGIDALEEGLRRGATEPGKVRELLGTLMIEDERWDDAARQCLLAWRDGYRSARMYANWGLARFHLGMYIEAADNLEEAVRLDDDDLFSRYTLGVVYMDYLLRPDLARQHFQAYRRAGGDDPKVDGWLRRLDG